MFFVPSISSLFLYIYIGIYVRVSPFLKKKKNRKEEFLYCVEKKPAPSCIHDFSQHDDNDNHLSLSLSARLRMYVGMCVFERERDCEMLPHVHVLCVCVRIVKVLDVSSFSRRKRDDVI